MRRHTSFAAKDLKSVLSQIVKASREPTVARRLRGGQELVVTLVDLLLVVDVFPAARGEDRLGSLEPELPS